MTNPKNALQIAMEERSLATRPLSAIEADQETAIRWAEDIARRLPTRVRRGRPAKGAGSGPSRSVTVRFPAAEAERILAFAERQGMSLSEFVRAAAFLAASGKR